MFLFNWQVYVILRPHLREFLQAMAKTYEVCVYWCHCLQTNCVYSLSLLLGVRVTWWCTLSSCSCRLVLSCCFPCVPAVCLHMREKGIRREDTRHRGPTEETVSVRLLKTAFHLCFVNFAWPRPCIRPATVSVCDLPLARALNGLFAAGPRHYYTTTRLSGLQANKS